jgi:hypothetical protein
MISVKVPYYIYLSNHWKYGGEGLYNQEKKDIAGLEKIRI